MLSDREEEKPLNMSEQPKRALKRSQASIRMKKINTPFHSFEEHVLMGKPREHVIAWSKSNPEEAGETVYQLLKAQRFASAMLDLNVTLLETSHKTRTLMKHIMQHAADLIDCERCSIFMYDREANELCSQVFDVRGDEESEDEDEDREPIRFSASQGIAGHVATTGETLNIGDAYQDPRFNRKVDAETGFVTKNILCMPIFDAGRQVIGVGQLINKKFGDHFDQNDEKAFELFSAYCGLALHNTQLYNQLKRDAARRQVALEMISYHTRGDPEEISSLMTQEDDGSLIRRLRSLVFDPLTITNDETLLACKSMFRDSGFMHKFRMDHSKLCAWLTCVKRSYRDVRYHNWKHAFNVGQFIFGIITSSQISHVFSDEEKLAFFIAALCHDLDHRGTNNAFQKKYSTALGDLYGTSTLEHHHFDRAIGILNTEGHNILENLPPNQFAEVVRFMEKAILATDLSKHFKHRKRYKDLVEGGSFKLENADHKFLLRNIVMTAADLCAVTKPFPAQRRVAELVYSEFFDQGDLEKALGTSSTELQDLLNRQKVNELPKLQIGFLDFVAGPVYETLSLQWSDLEILKSEMQRNRRDWHALQEAGPYEFVTPIEILTKRTKADPILPAEQNFEDGQTIAVDEV